MAFTTTRRRATTSRRPSWPGSGRSPSSRSTSPEGETRMSIVTKRVPVRARSAWKPNDFSAPDAFSFTLTGAHFAAFDAALAAHRRAARNVEDLTARDFALEPIAADVVAWRDEVLRGRGFIVLREFPRDRYSADDLGM